MNQYYFLLKYLPCQHVNKELHNEQKPKGEREERRGEKRRGEERRRGEKRGKPPPQEKVERSSNISKHSACSPCPSIYMEKHSVGQVQTEAENS